MTKQKIKMKNKHTGICRTPHVRASLPQGLFVSTRRRAVAHSRLEVQKYLEPSRHYPKKGCQMINLVPPRRIRAWERDGPLRLKECWSWHAWHECRLSGIQVRRPRLTATGTKTHPTWSVYQKNKHIRQCSLCGNCRCGRHFGLQEYGFIFKISMWIKCKI